MSTCSWSLFGPAQPWPQETKMQFVANASHELRTPLATNAGVARRGYGKGGPVPAPMAVLDERLRRELDHVDRLARQLPQSGSVWLQSGSVWLSLGSVWRGVAGEEAHQSRSTRPWSLLSEPVGRHLEHGLSVDQTPVPKGLAPAARRCWPIWSTTSWIDAEPLCALRFP